MKYIYSLVFLFCLNIIFAQLSVTTVQGSTPLNDGDVFNYDTTVFEEAKLKFKLVNTSTTETINVLAEMVSFTNTDGTNLQFCVQPTCFFDVSPGETVPNNPAVIPPGGDNGNFDYFSNTNPGDGVNYPMTYVIRIFMVDDNGVEVGDDITLTYNYTPENFSTSTFSLKDLGIALQNTIVSESLMFSTTDRISFSLYDVNGRKVKVFDANSGQHQVSLGNLSSGHYILIFEDKSARKVQVRIQKK